jgi:hypothetical protein
MARMPYGALQRTASIPAIVSAFRKFSKSLFAAIHSWLKHTKYLQDGVVVPERLVCASDNAGAHWLTLDRVC